MSRKKKVDVAAIVAVTANQAAVEAVMVVVPTIVMECVAEIVGIGVNLQQEVSLFAGVLLNKTMAHSHN